MVVGAALFEQFAQRVLDVVLVGEFQDRFVHDAAKPYHGLAHELRRPVAGTHQPRRLLAGEHLRGVLVDHHLDIGVCLQVRGGNLSRDLALDDLLHDLRLVLAPGHQDDAVGAHDRLDTHRDRHLGGVLQSEEGARLHLAGIVGELHETRARTRVGTRLVEADLTVLADADDHEVDPRGGALVGVAVLRDSLLGDRAVGDVYVLGQDVDVVDELLVDAVVAALLLGRADRVEFVEAEYGHVAEADLALLVAFHQFAVKPQRRAARGQAEHEGARLVVHAVRTVRLVVVADRPDDVVGDVLHGAVFVFIYVRADLLVAMDDVARGRFRDQAAVFRK